MATTPRGLIYPAETGHTRLWEHLQNLAESADAGLDDVVDALAPAGVRVYASAAARAGAIPAPAEGMTTYLEDVDQLDVYAAGAWRPVSTAPAAYNPTVTQSVSRGVTVNYSKYTLHGKRVAGNMQLTMTGNGAAANAIIISAPFAPAYGLVAVGSFAFMPASGVAGNSRVGALLYYSTGFQMRVDANAGMFGAAPSLALAVGDQFYLSYHYEIA